MDNAARPPKAKAADELLEPPGGAVVQPPVNRGGIQAPVNRGGIQTPVNRGGLQTHTGRSGPAVAPASSTVTNPTFSGANAWQQRHDWITGRLKEHLSQAVKQAELSPAQAADIAKRGPASPHWGTQIDTRFKQLVQNDPLLQGEVVVSPRRLPKGSGAPDVIDLNSKRWWDVTSNANEFGNKPPKYGTQYGEGTPLLYGEP